MLPKKRNCSYNSFFKQIYELTYNKKEEWERMLHWKVNQNILQQKGLRQIKGHNACISIIYGRREGSYSIASRAGGRVQVLTICEFHKII